MEKEEFYLSIINHLEEGVYYVNPERRIGFWNQGAEALSGYSASEMIGKCCPETGLNHIDLKGTPLCRTGCPLFSTLADGKEREAQVFLRHKEGYRVPVRVKVFPIREDGRITGAVEIFSQNAALLTDTALVDHLRREAMEDALTALPNRRYTESVLRFRLEEYHRFQKNFAVLFLDVDNFSAINNTYGHEAGDRVLKNLAQSFSGGLRRGDLIGRWGGEEFLGLFSVRDAAECEALAERFRSLAEGTGTEGLSVTVSAGMTAVLKEDDAESLVKRADRAMYKSKQMGKNRVTVL